VTRALSRALGRAVRVSTGALFVQLLVSVPVGALGIWVAARLFGEVDENLGGKALLSAFFLRLTSATLLLA
jgi:hypothetical protein